MTRAQHAKNITADFHRLNGSLLTSLADNCPQSVTAVRRDPDALVIDLSDLRNFPDSAFNQSSLFQRSDDGAAPPSVYVSIQATVVNVVPVPVALASTLQEHQLVFCKSHASGLIV
jgi:hypothetical protein